MAVVHRREVDAGTVHETVSEGDALRRVVVARDDEHAQPKCGELGEELVEELDRLRARNRLIVDITGEDDATVRLLLAQDRENLFQNVTLILQHRKRIDALPDMKIREMDEFHNDASPRLINPGCFHLTENHKSP